MHWLINTASLALLPLQYCIYIIMYVRMYVHIYICMYVCMYVCMYICTSPLSPSAILCACTPIRSCTRLRMYVCMYVCMYACWHCRYDVACRYHETNGVLGLSFNAVTQVNKFTWVVIPSPLLPPTHTPTHIFVWTKYMCAHNTVEPLYKGHSELRTPL